MTPLLWILFVGGFVVGVMAVLLGFYRAAAPVIDQTPWAEMLAQVREQVRCELEAEAAAKNEKATGDAATEKPESH